MSELGLEMLWQSKWLEWSNGHEYDQPLCGQLFSVWLYVCYVWCNESSIEMEICLKIVGLIGMFYPMSGKVGRKERLAVITTEKQIVWKLFNMNWTFIYLKIVWYVIKWDSLRGEFLFFES